MTDIELDRYISILSDFIYSNIDKAILIVEIQIVIFLIYILLWGNKNK